MTDPVTIPFAGLRYRVVLATLDTDRLARAIDRHSHAIGWDRMCEGTWCAAAIAKAYEEDEG